MKGFIIKQTAAGLCVAAAAFAIVGCTHYRDVVDPCWPTRYNLMAANKRPRDERGSRRHKGTNSIKTVWNAFFEKDPKTDEGTVILNGAGQEFLHSIARRQPVPDFHLWLQYANDIKDASKRDAVGEQRKLAIRTFLTKETKLGGGDNFQIDVHDMVMPTH